MSLAIPRKGLENDDVLDRLSSFRADDTDWRAGRTWSLVYHAGDEHSDLLKKAHALYFSENGLNPMAFRSLRRMEAEIIRMTATMLNAGKEAVGTLTSGGTESLLLAVKTYRDRARANKPWLRRPELVAPRTIHAAVDKACHYFGVRPRYADLGPDYRVDPEAMQKLVNRRTVMLLASAPQYPHGVVDPIERIGSLAAETRLPFHVDACFGGFVLPWLEKAGYDVPVWDFRVDGVTSISADLHKYGFAAKGASSIIYRDMGYMRHQFFVSTDWPGGIYVSPTIPGTRPGGPIAAAWASLMSMGQDGYVERSRLAMQTAEALREGIKKLPGVALVCEADAPVVAWMADDEGLDVFVIADRMGARGWEVGRQQHPSCVHMTVNANQAPIVERYLSDLADAVSYAREHPEAGRKGDAALYGMMAKVPFRGLVKQSVLEVMERMYAPDAFDVPDLERVGGSKESGLVLRLVDRYGDDLMTALDQASELRRRVTKLLRSRLSQ